jgi:hypothetical protein
MKQIQLRWAGLQQLYLPFAMVSPTQFEAVNARSILAASIHPLFRPLPLAAVDPSNPSLLHPQLTTIANSSTLWHPPSAITISIGGIASRLHHIHVPHQLWVGQSLFFLSGCDDKPSSASCLKTVMAIADVLFLPWSNWAKLSFVG